MLLEQRNYSPTCDNMCVSTVDNYQGEENDIILLSMVRSNDSGNIGFLKIANRVCVALSRAKLGLFIIGNMQQLCRSSALWRKIEEALKKIDGLGDALVLKCQSHPDRKVAVKTGEDFWTMSPECGCTRPWNADICICATWNADILATRNADIRTTGNADIRTTGNADILAPRNADILAPRNADILAPRNADILATRNADILATPNADI
ncbi:hypothetical protein HAZT_HAZT003234, partial [Hyalella azteca]